jgi:hypothetical protein
MSKAPRLRQLSLEARQRSLSVTSETLMWRPREQPIARAGEPGFRFVGMTVPKTLVGGLFDMRMLKTERHGHREKNATEETPKKH